MTKASSNSNNGHKGGKKAASASSGDSQWSSNKFFGTAALLALSVPCKINSPTGM